MTDEEVYINWRNNNSSIDRHNITETSRGHKHIHWNPGVDRRKAFLDGFNQGAKDINVLTKKLKMKEQQIEILDYKLNYEPCDIDCSMIKSLEESLDDAYNRENDLIKENRELNELLNRSNLRLAEEQLKYEELNDFSKSQCAILLKENQMIKSNFEKLLQELLDKQIIKSWYLNKSYHWEYRNDIN